MSREKIEELTCESCLHHFACKANSEYVPTPCCAYEDKSVYRKQSENMVEIVRCKDCRACDHCYPAKAKGEEAIEGWYCNFYKRYVKPNDFCSYGAKMKGGAE